MARKRNLAAIAALLGAGALASRKGTDLGPPSEEFADVDVRSPNFMERFENPYRKVTPSEMKAARQRVFASEPGLRNTVQSGDAYPIQTSDGMFLKFGQSFKEGGKVKSASSRGDGCAQRGKTRGKMV